MEFEKYTPNEKLPPAVIFDIDGTLAIRGDRSPYDWKKVGEDELNRIVFHHYMLWKKNIYDKCPEGHGRFAKIIIFTGRDACCEEETRKWLDENIIYYEHLYMRPEGNLQKDSLIKYQMLQNIKDKYNVVMVYDDRDQVVKMWREIGLTCFQVANGNF